MGNMSNIIRRILVLKNKGKKKELFKTNRGKEFRE